RSAGVIETEETQGRVGLDVILLVQTALESELQIMGAIDFAQSHRQLACVLTLLVVSIGIVPRVGIGRREIVANEHCWNSSETIRLQIGREAQGTQGVGIQARVVGENLFPTAGESKSNA